MDIQICQSCGIIIRGKSKFCTGCGATISKFSPTTLPVIAQSASPLAVAMDPDPLVLERTMNKVQYAGVASRSGSNEFATSRSGSGNGGYGATTYSEDPPYSREGNGSSYGESGGNGGTSGGGQSASYAYTPTAPAPSVPAEDIEEDFAPTGPAMWSTPVPKDADDVAPESRLQNILGSASANNAAPPQTMSDLISLEEETASSAYIQPEETNQSQSTQQFESAVSPGLPSNSDTYAGLVGESINDSGPITVTTATVTEAPPALVIPQQAAPVRPQPTAASTDFFGQTTAAQQTNREQNAASGPPMASNPAEASESSPPPPMSTGMPAVAAPLAPVAAAAVVAPPVAAPPVAAPPVAAPPMAPPVAAPVTVSEASFAPPPTTTSTSGGLQPVSTARTSERAESAENAANFAAQAVAASPQGKTGGFTPVSPGGGGFDFFAASGFGGSSNTTTAPTPAKIVQAREPEPEFEPEIEQLELEPEFEDDDADVPEGTPAIVADAIRAAAAKKRAENIESAASRIDAPKKSDGSKKGAKPRGKSTDTTEDDDEPRSKTKKGDSKKDSKTDDIPKRRSFSGKDDKPSKKSDRSERSDRSGADRGDNSNSDKKEQTPKTDSTIKLGPLQLKSSQLRNYAIFGGGGIIGIVILGMLIMSAFSAGSGGAGGGSSTLAGTWQIGAADTRGGKVIGSCILDQAGNAITGKGVDKYGSFAIVAGTYDPPKVQFQKVYVDRNNQPKTKPIQYTGVVDWVNPEPGKPPFFMHMYGQWLLSKREGMGWRGRSATYTGKWEGAMTELAQATAGGKVPDRSGGNPIANFLAYVFAVPQPGNTKGMADCFARIVIFIIIICGCMVGASVKLFGPAGLLNIWAKKEYIPSQFKSTWHKMLREFGKPLTIGGVPLGTRVDWNLFNCYMPRKLNMPPEVRVVNPHMLILGSGGKGKTRLMASMITHDIESNDRAVVVIDSDGNLVDLLMSWIASHKDGATIARRLIVLDPTRGGETLAYNPLEYPDDGDLQNASSAVVFGFKAAYTEPPGSQSQWNQQTANILRNSAMVLMANGRTLTDLPQLLTENDFRDVMLEKIEKMKSQRSEYITLLDAWAQYKRLARTDQWINWVEPILNRVQPMLGDPRIRPILTKAKGDLNLKEIISEGKILLVKVPQGQLEQNAGLLGSLLVTGIKQAALSLSLKSGSTRKHACGLYLDELDNFIEKETFDAIASETRKYQIGFVGCAKSMQDLPEDYRSKIVSNVGTMCCFSLVKKDADMIGPQMFRVDGRKVKHQTLQNIFNKVNTSPQFELISDEEKLNIDRVVGQEERTYFCYRVGTVAGVFQMRTPDFKDVPDKDVNWTLVDQIYARSVAAEE